MKAVKFIALTVLVGAFFFQCGTPQDQNTTEQTSTAMQDSTQRMILYQVFTRLFGNTNTNNIEWGTAEENGVGKFNDINETTLSAIKNMGYTHIWYTGVLEHAVIRNYTEYGIPLDDADVVKGRAGSPYAIKDYYDVNPDLAVDVDKRLEEFDALVKRSHDADLKVIIDFVPNHVARAYQSDQKPEGVIDLGADDNTSKAFDPDNNFYYLPGTSFKVPEGYNPLGEHSFPTKDGRFEETPAKASGNDVFSASPSVHDWFETVKLNYGVDYQNNRTSYFDPVPDTWEKMKHILLHWAKKGVDGFRCDMAEMVPVEFWHWVTAEVKAKYPDMIFIAEIYNPDNYRNYIYTGGFDYLYDKVELYDTLKSIIQYRASTDDLTQVWQRQEGIQDNMLRFLENHDEQRIASPDFAGDMNKGIPMMAVSAFMHRGPVMMYFGQDVGEPGSGVSGFSSDDGRTTIFDYWGVPEHIKWINDGKFDGGGLSPEQKKLQERYRNILKACNDLPEFRTGGFYDLHFYNRNEQFTGYSDRIYSFVRHIEGSARLVVVNFGESAETANIKIPGEALETFGLYTESISVVDGRDERSIDKNGLFGAETSSPLNITVPGLDYKIVQLKPIK
jgi:glycosidase